jgi:hypothetical protein
MQNAFENDLGYLEAQTTAADPAGVLTPLKLMMFANTHARFVELYYRGLLGGPLTDLWRQSAELCDGDEDPTWLETAVAGVDSRHQEGLERVQSHLRGLWGNAGKPGTAESRYRAGAAAPVAAVASCDRHFLADVKAAVRDGVEVFEQHEQATLDHGERILAALRAVPDTVETFNRELAQALPDG